MKKALVLCGGLPQIALIEELKKRRIETILLDMNEKVIARGHADRFYPVSVLDVEAIRQVALEEQVDYIITVCADQVLLVVAQLCEELGLPWYIDCETAKKVSDKSLMKRVFIENDIPTSKYVISEKYDTALIKSLNYPIIVKPVDSYSSRGVRKVQNTEELRAAFEQAVKISRTNTAIVEEFIEGKELSVDAYVENGKVRVLCISELNKIPGQDRFVINRCICPARISEAENKMISEVCQKIADAFVLKDSPMLVQLISTGDRISVLEFCARTGGGDKFRLIEKVSGFDVVKAVVDLTLGEKPDLGCIKKNKKFVLDEFLYCRPGKYDRAEGFEALVTENIISEYFLLRQPGDELREAVCSGDRAAYFTIESEYYDDLTAKLQPANAMIKVIGESGEDLLRHDLIAGFEQD